MQRVCDLFIVCTAHTSSKCATTTKFVMYKTTSPVMYTSLGFTSLWCFIFLAFLLN